MSSKYFKLSILTIVLAGLLVGVSFAQRPMDKGQRPERGDRIFERIPDMTEQQQEQIKQLRTDHLKEILPLRNTIREKKAQLNTLSTSDKADMTMINKIIEEIGELKVNVAKKKASHRQQIRKILTADQRVIFDSLPGKRGPHQQHEGGCGHQRIDRPGKRF